MKTERLIAPIVMMLVVAGAVSSQTSINKSDAWYQIAANYEFGFVKVLSHTIQIGEASTDFDYVRQGGQEILFPFQRYSLDLSLGKHHSVTLLYQPLTIETETRLKETVTIDDVTFDPQTSGGLSLKYGFPFWRASYLFHLSPLEGLDLGLGLSFQLRNASIVFKGTDGSGLTVSQNLGPVPILKLKARYDFRGGPFVATEVDGFYASSRFFNGADFEFEGSILDASLRGGFRLQDYLDAFFNVRVLGGSAVGTSEYPRENWSDSVSSYTSNYLLTTSLTIGLVVR